MTFADILLRLWKLRIWVLIGGVLAAVAAVASLTMARSTVYASASTEMLVDSPQSALGNADVDMTGYFTRANVFARLMTSAQALEYIGRAAHIPGNLIAASGPVETNGSPVASHSPTSVRGGNEIAVPATYKLNLVQNPTLPTISVYAEAPTTQQAIALANGAVAGFASFVDHVEASNTVPPGKRVEIRELGPATGGIVDPGASKKIAVLAFVAVLGLWCVLVLFAQRLRWQLSAASARDRQPHPSVTQSPDSYDWTLEPDDEVRRAEFSDTLGDDDAELDVDPMYSLGDRTGDRTAGDPRRGVRLRR